MKKKILFVGNSMTYYNYLPAMVKEIFASVGEDIDVTMVTEPGKCLLFHSSHKNTSFNILWGDYDVVVLQGVADGFNAETFLEGGQIIHDEYLSKTRSKTVLYLVWSIKSRPDLQPPMTAAYIELAKRIGAVVSPAGEVWHKILKTRPAPDIYAPDGNHPNPAGTYLAASTLFYTLSGRRRALTIKDGEGLHSRLGMSDKTARDIQRVACRYAAEYADMAEANKSDKADKSDKK